MPLSNLRDTHIAIRLAAHRNFIHSQCRIQPGAESIAAPLVRADTPNVEVLTDFEPVYAVGNLAVRSRVLDARTEISVLQRNTVPIAAGGIDDLTVRDGTVRFDPVTLPPTVCSGRIDDLLAVAMSLCW